MIEGGRPRFFSMVRWKFPKFQDVIIQQDLPKSRKLGVFHETSSTLYSDIHNPMELFKCTILTQPVSSYKIDQFFMHLCCRKAQATAASEWRTKWEQKMRNSPRPEKNISLRLFIQHRGRLTDCFLYAPAVRLNDGVSTERKRKSGRAGVSESHSEKTYAEEMVFPFSKEAENTHKKCLAAMCLNAWPPKCSIRICGGNDRYGYARRTFHVSCGCVWTRRDGRMDTDRSQRSLLEADTKINVLFQSKELQ